MPPGLVIYALPFDLGILGLAPIPGGGGDYAGDLQHLRDWRPALVVSLTDSAEMAAAGAAGLGQDLMDTGTRWVHLPIPDYGIPDPETEERWHMAANAALAALHGGGRVLFHCRGGCGRSGMAVLRLMIEAGEDPDTALARLRAIRPCAVETDAQLAWARAG